MNISKKSYSFTKDDVIKPSVQPVAHPTHADVRYHSERDRIGGSVCLQNRRWFFRVGKQVLLLVVICLAVVLGSCQPEAAIPSKYEVKSPAFWVNKINLQPAFTKAFLARDDLANPGYIEAYIVLRDQYGDPMKALGKFRFEMYQYRPAFADPRGKRFDVNGVQVVDLENIEVNQQHWNSITRSYKIELKLPDLSRETTRFVLQATFIIDDNYRLQDMIKLQFEK